MQITVIGCADEQGPLHACTESFGMLHGHVDPVASVSVRTGIVTDCPAAALALAEVLCADGDITVIGTSSPLSCSTLLNDTTLRVLIVNLSLAGENGAAPGLEFIRKAKRQRPDVGILSLKRKADEDQLRAALDAGADACCLTVTQASRLRKAVKVVADGATWLDQEVARALFRGDGRAVLDTRSIRLSPREREILSLVIEGHSNHEIAGQLDCSNPTVRTHLTHLYRKIGVKDRVSAAVYGLRHGLA